ncbi:TMEM165/GDT1 family protein [Lyngbya aestuarii]|uniref:TMEM165/GDT1 family protein n=1 Tax=Lyngbya aestuarii TaxID=118322 RepID=UPI00403DA1E2
MKLSDPSPVSPILSVSPTLLPPELKDREQPSESASQNPVTPPFSPEPVEKPSWSQWSIFSSTFLTIFLAEMGDKTQLATLLITAQSQSPWIVFAGAAAALIATSLLGVLIGHWLAKRLAPKTLETAAGALLLFISVMLLWDVVQIGS